MSSVSSCWCFGLLILWFMIWELVGVHIWDEPTSWLVELVLEYGCGDGPLCYYGGLLCSCCGLLCYYCAPIVDYWVTIGCATIVLLLGSLPLWLGWLPLCLLLVTIGLRSLWVGLITPSDSWLLTSDLWCDLVDCWFGWLGGWCWDVFLCWFLWVLWIVRLIPCYSLELGCSLLDCVLLVSHLWFVMHYAFVIGYWLYLIESWFMIRSAYCCWVSVLNYWTVRWCLYSIRVCKPIYKLMYIYISLRVWMVVA